MIVLIGFMGAGKSTIGPLLADRLGLGFIDTDAAVEARAGKSVAEIFTTDGEGHFRSLERTEVLAALEGPDAVIALGGGAILDESVRSALEQVRTIYLEVTAEEVDRRVGEASTRPLLAERDAASLLAERRPLYESVADVRIATDGRQAREVTDEILRLLGDGSGDIRTVRVGLGDRSYFVSVGAGIAGDPGLLPSLPDAEKAFLVTHRDLESLAAPVTSALELRGLTVHTLIVPAGEEGKSLEAISSLYAGLQSAGAHRHDLVVTFGGGVVSDVGGFAASTYVRGMRLVHVPTTLLGQVDAAVGGKTGINLSHGKNLVGTIYQPTSVICDVSFLTSCPPEEIRSGLAEVIKYGFIADPELLHLVAQRWGDIERLDPVLLVDLVARCVAIKAAIVSEDERETGDRAWLNYGHTYAHGIEALSGFTGIRHGEAVAIGMMAAAFTAHELQRIDDDVVNLHRDILRTAGLPTGMKLDLGRLEQAWKHDKKYRGGNRFVLLAGLGKPEADVLVPRPVLARALERLAEEEGT